MLNEAQKEAAETLEGPLLILAGAGAGKTKTLVERIANLVISGVEPRAILAITFTNKAAKEMRDRVAKRLRKQPESLSMDSEPFISTFHALGVYIIKEQSKRLELPRHFAIYDRNESKKAVKESIKESGLDTKQFDPGKILGIISRAKGEMLDVYEYSSLNTEDYMSGIVSEVWKKYEKKLKDDKALDFDDLLLKTSKLLKNPEVLEHYQNIWKYIHIDEYQDTNKVQYEIARLLSNKYKNICAVGDIDQNIYSWRGAKIRNIIDFEKDYVDAKIVILEENYRSTKIILDAANTIIEKNKFRKEKNLFTKKTEGEFISLFVGLDEMDEAYFVAEKAKGLIESGVEPNEIAVLYRANFQSRVLEESFMQNDIPYQVLGTRFYERQEIKDVLSYIGASLDQENMAFLKRIVNTPTRGIGKVSFLKILSGQEDKLPAKTKASYNNLQNILEKIRGAMETHSTSEVVKLVIEESGLGEMYKRADEEDRIENIRELVTLAKRYDGIPTLEAIEKFLTDASLSSDQDEMDRAKKNGVKLMTVHASKGLEFDSVFITGLEDGLFPHAKIGDKENMTGEEEEEERRLFYVALTRAKKKVFLSYAQSRTIFGTRTVNVLSEFIVDIPEHLIENDDGGGKNRKRPLLVIDF